MITKHVSYISIPIVIEIDDRLEESSYEHKQQEATEIAINLQKSILDSRDATPIENIVTMLKVFKEIS